MFIKLDWTPIFEPCQRHGCAWLDASGNVRLEDDTAASSIWCRWCAGDLMKALLSATLLPPVCGGGPASFDYDPLDLALIACWEAEGNPSPPSAEEVAATS
jgi:hypothetical protein